MIHKNNKSMV